MNNIFEKIKHKTYVSYSDGGHGWLKVPLKDLIKLGILEKITSYSYHRGDFVYLEEDQDVSTFFNEYEKFYGVKPLNKAMPQSNKQSRIRNYASFNYERALCVNKK